MLGLVLTLQGMKKLLEVQISCQGHDSERYTDSRDITGEGFARNFITAKNARLVVTVTDDQYGEGSG